MKGFSGGGMATIASGVGKASGGVVRGGGGGGIERSSGSGNFMRNTVPLVAGQTSLDTFKRTSALKDTVKIASSGRRGGESLSAMPRLFAKDISQVPSVGKISPSDIRKMDVIARNKDLTQLSKVRASLAPIVAEAKVVRSPVTPKSKNTLFADTVPYIATPTTFADKRIGRMDMRDMKVIVKGEVRPAIQQVVARKELARIKPHENASVFARRITTLAAQKISQEIASSLPIIKTVARTHEYPAAIKRPVLAAILRVQIETEEEKKKKSIIEHSATRAAQMPTSLAEYVRETSKRVVAVLAKKESQKIGTIVLPDTQRVARIQAQPKTGTILLEGVSTDIAPAIQQAVQTEVQQQIQLKTKQQMLVDEGTQTQKDTLKKKFQEVIERIFEQDPEAMKSRSEQAHSVFHGIYQKAYQEGAYVTGHDVASHLRQTDDEKSAVLKTNPRKVIDNSFIGFVRYIASVKHLYDPFHAFWMIRKANTDNPAVRTGTEQTTQQVSDEQVRLVLGSTEGNPERIAA